MGKLNSAIMAFSWMAGSAFGNIDADEVAKREAIAKIGFQTGEVMIASGSMLFALKLDMIVMGMTGTISASEICEKTFADGDTWKFFYGPYESLTENSTRYLRYRPYLNEDEVKTVDTVLSLTPRLQNFLDAHPLRAETCQSQLESKDPALVLHMKEQCKVLQELVASLVKPQPKIQDSMSEICERVAALPE